MKLRIRLAAGWRLLTHGLFDIVIFGLRWCFIALCAYCAASYLCDKFGDRQYECENADTQPNANYRHHEGGDSRQLAD